MKRDDLTEKIIDTKRSIGMSWEDIAEKIGGCSPILITAALLGQMKLSPAQANRARDLFNLSEAEAKMLTEIPYRGSLPSIPPTDPLVYRFYELVQVYGTTWKELIQEEFGDGIMSRLRYEARAGAGRERRSGENHHVGQIPTL